MLIGVEASDAVNKSADFHVQNALNLTNARKFFRNFPGFYLALPLKKAKEEGETRERNGRDGKGKLIPPPLYSFFQRRHNLWGLEARALSIFYIMRLSHKRASPSFYLSIGIIFSVV